MHIARPAQLNRERIAARIIHAFHGHIGRFRSGDAAQVRKMDVGGQVASTGGFQTFHRTQIETKHAVFLFYFQEFLKSRPHFHFHFFFIGRYQYHIDNLLGFNAMESGNIKADPNRNPVAINPRNPFPLGLGWILNQQSNHQQQAGQQKLAIKILFHFVLYL